jgi:hypothetical protein
MCKYRIATKYTLFDVAAHQLAKSREFHDEKLNRSIDVSWKDGVSTQKVYEKHLHHSKTWVFFTDDSC